MDISQYKLDGNADAVEFCPSHPYHDLLAAATYNLQEGEEPTRSGSISLFRASDGTGLEFLQKVETVGVFDIKWKPDQAGAPCQLAQADACGYLRLYDLESNAEEGTCSGNIECFFKAVDAVKISSSMCLCLDWNTSATMVSLGLSDGSASVVNVTESELHCSQSWDAHSYEVWSTCFDLHQMQLLYTGSDDCRLCCWDIRQGLSKPVFQNVKSHTMGVCCIAKNHSDSNMLITGSYDEQLRVWDLRSALTPINHSSLDLGGGVWRIKYHPDDAGLLLAACMHNGFVVVRMTGDDFEVTEKYLKHDSLAYGADWRKGKQCSIDGTRRGPMVATCSFYDKLLHIWIPQTLFDEKF